MTIRYHGPGSAEWDKGGRVCSAYKRPLRDLSSFDQKFQIVILSIRQYHENWQYKEHMFELCQNRTQFNNYFNYDMKNVCYPYLFLVISIISTFLDKSIFNRYLTGSLQAVTFS